MEAYFDNSATTRVLDSVMDIVTRTMTVDYANPAAKHIKGMEELYPGCQKHHRKDSEGSG